MNDDELKEILRRLPAPPPSEEAREYTLLVSQAALRQSTAPPRSASRQWSWIAAPAFAAALVLIVVGKVLWPVATRSADDAQVFAEMEALFPEQLAAVVTQGDQVDLQLTSGHAPQSDQRVVVKFVRGNQTVRVLSYSGRQTCVDLGGHRACFEALIDERGEVIVVGEDFVWGTGAPASVMGWKIEASTLRHSS